MRETEGNTENKLIAERRRKLDLLRARGLAFPNDFKPTHRARDIGRDCENLKAEALAARAPVGLAGRVIRMRGPFFVIDDDGAAMQVYCDLRKLEQALAEQVKLLDLGDIIGVEGALFRTRTGELTRAFAGFSAACQSSAAFAGQTQRTCRHRIALPAPLCGPHRESRHAANFRAALQNSAFHQKLL